MNIIETNTQTLSILEEAPAYHRWIIEKINPWLRGKILEVGCGTGNLTELLLQHGKVIPSDVNEAYLRTVERKFKGRFNLGVPLRWDIQTLPPPDLEGPMDTIVCSNVLEHIEEDEEALGHCFRLLSPGGRLILLVPALKWLYNSLDQELGHCRRYSRAELVQKLKNQGFRIARVMFFNGFGVLGWFVNGTILRRRILPRRQARLFNRMVPLFLRIEKGVPTFIGQSLIAIGEKEMEA
jgi:2-polyprenyl-3-methyl-5-hydroxy-6-metoxy-1,4-benzoquinol methylase